MTSVRDTKPRRTRTAKKTTATPPAAPARQPATRAKTPAKKTTTTPPATPETAAAPAPAARSAAEILADATDRAADIVGLAEQTATALLAAATETADRELATAGQWTAEAEQLRADAQTEAEAADTTALAVTERAERAALQIREQARREADQVLADARAEAGQATEQTVAEAEQRAAELTQAATDTAARTLADAEEKAGILTAEADQAAETIRADAAVRAETVLADAEQAAATVTRAAEHQAEELRAAATAQAQLTEQQAETVLAAAEQKAGALTRAATAQAETLRTQAQNEVTELRDQAERHATKLRTGARIQADTVLTDARTQADGLLAGAREQAEELRRTAQADADRVRAEVRELREEADREIDEATKAAREVRGKAQAEADQTRTQAAAEIRQERTRTAGEAARLLEAAGKDAQRILREAEKGVTAIKAEADKALERAKELEDQAQKEHDRAEVAKFAAQRALESATSRTVRQLERRRLKREAKAAERAGKTTLTAKAKAFVKANSRRLLAIVPITAPMAVAWTGQAGFAHDILGWVAPFTILFAAAWELSTAFVAWMYHQARQSGDSGTLYRVSTWVFAIGAAVMNYWHASATVTGRVWDVAAGKMVDQVSYWDPTPKAVAFSVMSITGMVLWELYASLLHRQKLRADGKVAKSRPTIGLIRWARYPSHSFTAWSLAITDESLSTVELAWTAAANRRAAVRRTDLGAVRRFVAGLIGVGEWVPVRSLPRVSNHSLAIALAGSVNPAQVPQFAVRLTRSTPANRTANYSSGSVNQALPAARSGEPGGRRELEAANHGPRSADAAAAGPEPRTAPDQERHDSAGAGSNRRSAAQEAAAEQVQQILELIETRGYDAVDLEFVMTELGMKKTTAHHRLSDARREFANRATV
ncbi:hypothetical protein ACIA8O_38820 [Kitasatospora sp. NPDC051853]|uniref:hypothetical protein n=1 Tax=Kitasatospora sp. NPDC051853 TaxID=3364058 RepID=UPI0037AFF122